MFKFDEVEKQIGDWLRHCKQRLARRSSGTNENVDNALSNEKSSKKDANENVALSNNEGEFSQPNGNIGENEPSVPCAD